MVQRHMNVGRKDSNQKRNQPPGHDCCETRKKKEAAQDYFKQAAQIDQQQMPGKVGRHDFQVESRIDEVIDTGEHEENSKQVFQDQLEFLHEAQLTAGFLDEPSGAS